MRFFLSKLHSDAADSVRIFFQKKYLDRLGRLSLGSLKEIYTSLYNVDEPNDLCNAHRLISQIKIDHFFFGRVPNLYDLLLSYLILATS